MSHGGKRAGAGRKAVNNYSSKTIRVPEALVSTFEQMRLVYHHNSICCESQAVVELHCTNTTINEVFTVRIHPADSS